MALFYKTPSPPPRPPPPPESCDYHQSYLWPISLIGRRRRLDSLWRHWNPHIYPSNAIICFIFVVYNSLARVTERKLYQFLSSPLPPFALQKENQYQNEIIINKQQSFQSILFLFVIGGTERKKSKSYQNSLEKLLEQNFYESFL